MLLVIFLAKFFPFGSAEIQLCYAQSITLEIPARK